MLRNAIIIPEPKWEQPRESSLRTTTKTPGIALTISAAARQRPLNISLLRCKILRISLLSQSLQKNIDGIPISADGNNALLGATKVAHRK